MRDAQHNVVAMLMVVTLLSIGASVWGEPSSKALPRRKVAVTIFPLYDLVRTVAGAAVEVVLLVPPGASPHTFAAKPSTIRALAGSAAIFAIGHGLDDWATRLAGGAGVSHTIVVDAQIPLRAWESESHEHEAAAHEEYHEKHDLDDRTAAVHVEPHEEHEKAHEHDAASAQAAPREKPESHESALGHAHPYGAVDPHYWLTIPNAVRMVQTIVAALGRLDPAHEGEYLQRAAAYRIQLQAVDNDIRQLFAALPRRELATFHPAFGYFAAAYGLHVVTSFEPTPGKEPAPRHVAQFLHQLQAHKLRVLFIEPQLPQAPLFGLARDLGMTLKELDPMGGGEGRKSYIAMMRFNAVQIATTLRE